MGRQINRLNARFVQTVKEPGQYADGGGLYLLTTNGGRRWIFLFRWQKKRCEMGLGSARDVSLAAARELAATARNQLRDNRNPVDVREAEKAAAAAQPPELLTFGTYAEAYIASVEEGWRNDKHRQQWRNSLRDHAKPLADKPIADISTDDVLEVLRPIWRTIPETANRVRGRIEKILSAAKATGLRSRDSANPAQWRGHLDVLLPKRITLSRGHHAAMAYAEVPLLMRKLASRDATAARALEFLILNASRTSEVLGARWSEIHEDTWIVPADRMKAGIPHTVTLSAAAQALLEEVGRGAPNDFVFAGSKPNSRLSNMSMEMLLRRMKVENCTVHGFRSAFKDWAADCTETPDEISEEALAHIVGSKIRRAYRRGEALERRRALMEAWARYLGAAPALSVVLEQAA
jgi:integrase